MEVFLIDPQSRKDELVGQEWTNGGQFNPWQDGNGEWVISVEEVQGCANPDFQWVKDLPKIEYVPPYIPPAFP